MVARWKKILLLVIIASLFYICLNTQSILSIESYFRMENPKLGLTPKVCYFLGNVSYLTFRYNLAIDIIDRNLKDFPYESGATKAKYRRANCYEKLGEYHKAIELYEDFLFSHPRDKRCGSIQNRIAKLRILHSST